MRCFVAAELPVQALDALSARMDAGAPALGRLGWKRAPAATLHITLVFLGEIADDEANQVAACLEGSLAGIGPIPIELGRIGFIDPRRKKGTVLAVEVGDPSGSLARAQQRALQCARLSSAAIEDRPFRPHVTVARSRVPLPDPKLEAGEPEAFASESLALFESQSGKGGSVYRALGRYPLRG